MAKMTLLLKSLFFFLDYNRDHTPVFFWSWALMSLIIFLICIIFQYIEKKNDDFHDSFE